MGAMLRFRQQTGRELTALQADSITDVCTYLYCCVASAAKREGIEFTMSLMDFADAITPEDMLAWQQAVSEEESARDDAAESGEKKSR